MHSLHYNHICVYIINIMYNLLLLTSVFVSLSCVARLALAHD